MAFDQTASGLMVPNQGVDTPQEAPKSVLIDNRTELPDDMVQAGVQTYFEENASLAGTSSAAFQTYAAEGSLLTRTKYNTPGNVFQEIALARDLADRDDDVRATIGAMMSVAYRDGMENLHPDEEALHIFNKAARHANMDMALKRMYREYLIAGSVTTVVPLVRQSFSIQPEGVSRRINRTVGLPRIGILPAENVRILDDDMFGAGTLGYKPPMGSALEQWLTAYFSDTTTPAKKGEMRREKPVWASLFIEKVSVGWNDLALLQGGMDLYRLNPDMAQRVAMPADGDYPRPPLTSSFALLEAKRLLNLMDFSMLQGGVNFIVVVKKGSDARPAEQDEITNLREVVRKASRTGVIIGDHRLSLEIITPDLTEVLNSSKRELLSRRLVSALLRIPARSVEEASTEGERTATEIMSAVITSDRNDIRRHAELAIYGRTLDGNPSVFVGKEPAKIWHSRIVLQGLQYFTDLILKLRDRGDIPRSYAVEAGGFDYDAAVQQRRRELERGDDEIMVPGDVPYSSPESGPQDNNNGRPPGARTGREDDRPRPRRTIRRTRGETIRAEWDEELNAVVRVGELTASVLEEFPEHTIGRVTAIERRAVETREIIQEGPLIAVPVNPDYQTRELRAVRLNDQGASNGISMIVGQRPNGAIVAKALVFRDSEHSIDEAEARALRWGFPVPEREDD